MLMWVLLCSFVFASNIESHPDMAQEHLQLLNNYRVSQGKWTLEYNQEMSDCLELYLRRQINEWFHGHYDPEWWDPTTRCGYLSYAGIGENLIATDWNLPTAQNALELRISSPSHNRNMLYEDYVYAWIAVVYEPSTRTARRWQVFTVWPLRDGGTWNTTTTPSTSTTTNYTTTNNALPRLDNREISEAYTITKDSNKLLRIELMTDYTIDRSDSEWMSEKIITSLSEIFGTTANDGLVPKLKYWNLWTSSIKDNGSRNLLRVQFFLDYDIDRWNPREEAHTIVDTLDGYLKCSKLGQDLDFLEVYNAIDDYQSTENELQTAITWMYNSWLTMYNTIDDFLPNNTMTREEASKFFSVFAKTIFNKPEDLSNTCSFRDINKADPTLQASIHSACRLGIFKWYNRYFSPFDKLTNAQAITVLMRIMIGQMEEPTTAFYSNYVAKAKEYWLIDSINLNQNITRGEAAILLYKAAHR